MIPACLHCGGKGFLIRPDFSRGVEVAGFGPLPASKQVPCPDCGRVKAAILAEREACAAEAEADLLGEVGGMVPAQDRFDGGASEKTARRIATRIRQRPAP